MIVEAYFDESDHDKEPEVFVVSGYIFEKNNCLMLDQEWSKVLAEFGRDGSPLPYFRMSACAHNNEPFDHLSRERCDQAARRCIKIIRDHMTYGLSSSVRRSELLQWLPSGCDARMAAYVWCCLMSFVGVRVWAEQNGFFGSIAYFFEAGSAHQTTANAVMNYIFQHPEHRAAFRYGSHSFVPKELNRPVQTADILAWHHVQDFKRAKQKKPRRKDYLELVRDREDRYRIIHGRKSLLQASPSLALFSELIEIARRGVSVAGHLSAFCSA